MAPRPWFASVSAASQLALGGPPCGGGGPGNGDPIQDVLSLPKVELMAILDAGLPTTCAAVALVSEAACLPCQTFCLKLALLATLLEYYGGLDGRVVYIDTEFKFSSRRMIEIGQKSFPQIFRQEGLAQKMAGVHTRGARHRGRVPHHLAPLPLRRPLPLLRLTLICILC